MIIFELFKTIADAIILLIHEMGYFGIFIGMAIESSFIPLPSEIVIIPAGVLIAQGKMHFLPAFLAAVFGSLVGSLFSYVLGLFLGRKTIDFIVGRYGKLMFINKKNLRKTDEFYKKHGEITTFVGRLIFGVRHFISVPAGFAKMNIFKFSVFTSLGASLWVTLLLLVGMFFGNDGVDSTVKSVAAMLFVACLIGSLIYYFKHTNKDRIEEIFDK